MYRKLFFKVLFNLGVHRLLKKTSSTIYVLCFHRVSNETSLSYPPLLPSVFEGIIKYLAADFEIVDFSDLKTKSCLNLCKPWVIISFDDGYYDFYQEVYPLLKEYKVPVTLNVVIESLETGLPTWTQRIVCLVEEYSKRRLELHCDGLYYGVHDLKGSEEKTALRIVESMSMKSRSEIDESIRMLEKGLEKVNYTPMIRFEHLKEMMQSGWVKPGSHTFSHLNLQHREELILKREIIESKLYLERRLGCEIDRFAFPNGGFCSKSIEIAKQAGYSFIQLTEEKPFLPSSSLPYLIPRIMPYHKSVEENIFRILGFHKYLNRFRHKKDV